MSKGKTSKSEKSIIASLRKKKQGNVPSRPPRPLRSDEAEHRTSSYEKYDIQNPPSNEKLAELKIDVRINPVLKRAYDSYNEYLLYSNLTPSDITDLPFPGVRLDDLAASWVLTAYFAGKITKNEMHRRWPVEFDEKGMIRATRAPLGLATKIYVKEGDKDLDGKTVKKSERGWYYKWWEGLHVLCGDEGFSKYMVRPSWEELRTQELKSTHGFGFKMGWKAAMQAGEGREREDEELFHHN